MWETKSPWAQTLPNFQLMEKSKCKEHIDKSETQCLEAGPRSAVGRAPDSSDRGAGFDTRSGCILSFLLPLIQEGQLSVTGESMCTKYWLTA